MFVRLPQKTHLAEIDDSQIGSDKPLEPCLSSGFLPLSLMTPQTMSKPRKHIKQETQIGKSATQL
jgi:hypothetical protein